MVPTPRQQRLSEAQALRQSAGPEGGPEGGSLGSDGGTSPAGGGPDAEGGCFTEGADDLMIQEDGVEWGEEGGAGDPALQHAMALIRSKGERVWIGLLSLIYPAIAPMQPPQLLSTLAQFLLTALNTLFNQILLVSSVLCVSQ